MIPQSPLRLVKAAEEFIDADNIDKVPKGLRGIYVLYKKGPNRNQFDVVYVGMAAEGGIRPRLHAHRKKKSELWTHCSIFAVWDNIRTEEIRELEGMFRHIYRKDVRANRLNIQKSFAKVKLVRSIFDTKG